MERNNSINLMAAVISLVSAWAIVSDLWIEALLGWGLGLLSNLAGNFLKKIDLGTEEGVRRFSILSFLRLIGLLISVFLVLSFLRVDQMAFVYALMISYAVFMVADVILIYQAGKVAR